MYSRAGCNGACTLQKPPHKYLSIITMSCSAIWRVFCKISRLSVDSVIALLKFCIQERVIIHSTCTLQIPPQEYLFIFTMSCSAIWRIFCKIARLSVDSIIAIIKFCIQERVIIHSTCTLQIPRHKYPLSQRPTVQFDGFSAKFLNSQQTWLLHS